MSFASTGLKVFTNHQHQEVTAKQNPNDGNCSQFVSEEKETETEKSLEIQEIQLPFLASLLQLDFSSSFHTHQQPLCKLATAPIYLSVCNFRIWFILNISFWDVSRS